MTRCLDEGTLQAYFDGELSIEAMESATSHLAACSTCAMAAQEIEQETSLLTEAFAAEFNASVPTERLRQRIDAAVLGVRVEAAQAAMDAPRAGLFSSLFSFRSSRSLGYASLVVLIAFAVVIAVVKMRTSTPVQAPPTGEVAKIGPEPQSSPARQQDDPVVPAPVGPVAIKSTPKRVVPNKSRRESGEANHVKLIPGERSYLQAIARLNSAIKSDKQAMRPALQVEYERNLAVVDRAIAATRNAAKSNPNDPDAADFMFAAYQSKVDLLNTIADARVGGRSH
jgi:hypothetical protein